MIKIIAKLLIPLLIIGVIILASIKLCEKNVYEVVYDTYRYEHTIGSQVENTLNYKYTVRAHSIDEAKELTKDMLYLNSLCVSDKVVIRKVVEL